MRLRGAMMLRLIAGGTAWRLRARPLHRCSGDALAEGFRSPPDSAKPRTWWHWTNGNVTEEGITKDLEWMKRVRNRWVSAGGCGGGEWAGGGEEDQFWDAGVVSRGEACGGRGKAAEAGDVDLQLAGLERGGWAVGEARAGDEEAGVERDESRGAAEFAGKLAEPPSNEGPVRDL